MKFDTVLIDLDDTLLDFGAASRASLIGLLRKLGRELTPQEVDRFEVINSGVWREHELGLISRDELSRKRFDIFLKELGIVFDSEEASKLFRLGLSESAVLIPGAKELCESLKNKVDLYLVTNGFVETQNRRIAAAGLEGMFKARFASQQIGFSKPDGRFFDAVFSSIGEDRRRSSVILGDSLTSDMEGGRRASIATCWFNRFGGEPTSDCDFVITSLDRFIPDVLEI